MTTKAATVQVSADLLLRALRETVPVLSEVIGERNRQNQKWGEQNYPAPRWFAVLMEEVGEASEAFLDATHRDDTLRIGETLRPLRDELIQVAAVAVAMIECGDRNGWWEDE